jgi:hypothetical protein
MISFTAANRNLFQKIGATEPFAERAQICYGFGECNILSRRFSPPL